MGEDSTSVGNSDTHLTMEPVPAVVVQPTLFQPQGTPPFQSAMGSPFAAGSNGTAQPTDALAADKARKHIIKTEGAKLDIPEHILDLAATEGHSWELTRASYFQAKMAGELYLAKGQEQDLSHSPLAFKMANFLVQSHQAANTPVPTVAKDEATTFQDFAAAAGLS